jgi:hypothetical protein
MIAASHELPFLPQPRVGERRGKPVRTPSSIGKQNASATTPVIAGVFVFWENFLGCPFLPLFSTIYALFIAAFCHAKSRTRSALVSPRSNRMSSDVLRRQRLRGSVDVELNVTDTPCRNRRISAVRTLQSIRLGRGQRRKPLIS